ncbi:UNVERIFIED_CONTAM: hypothetical protein K2H54_074740 [Gekko kuhli]
MRWKRWLGACLLFWFLRFQHIFELFSGTMRDRSLVFRDLPFNTGIPDPCLLLYPFGTGMFPVRSKERHCQRQAGKAWEGNSPGMLLQWLTFMPYHKHPDRKKQL